MEIYCAGCRKNVEPRLIDGKERYPHRPDLTNLRFWKCDTCGNSVGCHGKGTNPMGCIATPEIVRYRKEIHALIDPLWQVGKVSRSKVYARISKFIGRTYHTGEIRSVAEAQAVLQIAKKIGGG